MNPITRGIRNAFRNGVRTISIVAILGISIGLALSMMIARGAVSDKITSVKSSVGNTISISPAGARGFEGGGEPLTSADITTIKQTTGIASVTSTLSDRLTTSNTNLVAAIEAGSLGQRNSSNSGVAIAPPADMPASSTTSASTNNSVGRSFTPPVMISGIDSFVSNSVYGSSTVTYTSGYAFDPTVDKEVAVIGKGLAEKNNLNVGSTFTAYGTTITVVGIYDTGNTFSNAGLLVPLSTLQRLTNQTGLITSVSATVDSIDNLATTTTTLKTALGTKADITNSQDVANNAIQPLESVQTISTYSFFAALGAGAVIILLTMLMIVRERRREIGVMKATGSGNTTIMLQFIVESVTLTLLGLVIGLGVAFAAASPLTSTMVTNASSSSQSTPGVRGPRGGNFGQVAGQNLRTIETSVGWQSLGYGVGVALLIAIVGSAVPAYFISKVRPSEVLRSE